MSRGGAPQPDRHPSFRRRPESTPSLRTNGPLKFAGDVFTVAETKLIAIRHSWYWFVLAALVVPLPIFYLAYSIAPDDPEVVRRIMAGTLVFGASFTTGIIVGQGFASERFMGMLKLMVTMPVSKAAYVLGSLIYSSLTGGLTVAVLLGMVLAIISPVYFTMEEAPLVQKWLGYVSPLRYAADAIDASLSGRSDVLIELAVLSAFAIAAMCLGLWKLPWRER